MVGEELSPRARSAFLVAILAFVALVHAAPHWDPFASRSTGVPVHMDEYGHWGFAKATLDEGQVNFGNPFTGEPPRAFSPSTDLHERGYQLLLAVVHDATGIPLDAIVVATPVAVGILLALSAYALAQPWGAGLEAALWTAAIPTTLRFLGPGFAVPIAFAMVLLLVGLFFAFHVRRAAGLAATGLLLATIWTVHAMGALALSGIVAIYALATLRSRPWYSAALLAVVVLPFAFTFPYYASFSATYPLGRSPELPASLEALRLIGAPLLVFASIGAMALAWRSDTPAAGAGTALASGLIAFGGIILIRNVADIDPFRLYDRSVMVASVLAAILAGVGTAAILRSAARFAPARLRAPALVLGLILASGLVAWEARDAFGRDYYDVLTPERRAVYEEVGEALRDQPGYAIVEGISTMAFTDVTGRPTIFVRYPGDSDDPPFAREFFENGARDTYLLVTTGTTVVVTDRPVNNPDLVPVAQGVWRLNDELLARMRGDK